MLASNFIFCHMRAFCALLVCLWAAWALKYSVCMAVSMVLLWWNWQRVVNVCVLYMRMPQSIDSFCFFLSVVIFVAEIAQTQPHLNPNFLWYQFESILCIHFVRWKLELGLCVAPSNFFYYNHLINVWIVLYSMYTVLDSLYKIHLNRKHIAICSVLLNIAQGMSMSASHSWNIRLVSACECGCWLRIDVRNVRSWTSKGLTQLIGICGKRFSSFSIHTWMKPTIGYFVQQLTAANMPHESRSKLDVRTKDWNKRVQAQMLRKLSHKTLYSFNRFLILGPILLNISSWE